MQIELQITNVYPMGVYGDINQFFRSKNFSVGLDKELFIKFFNLYI